MRWLVLEGGCEVADHGEEVRGEVSPSRRC